MYISKALGVAPGYYGLSMNSLTVGAFGLVGSEKVGLGAAANKAIDSWGYGAYVFVPVLKSKDGKNRAQTMSLEGQFYMAANMAFNSATGSTVVGNNTATAPNLTGAKGYGVAGQVIFFATQDLGITGGYQRRNAYHYASFVNTATGQQNFEKTNELIYGNVSYDLNAAVRVAAEYEHQKTLYGNVVSGTGNLLGTSGLGQDNTIRFAAYYFF
jgi:hypothetical protein